MTSDPLDYFEKLTERLDKDDNQYIISGDNLKLKFNTSIEDEEVQVQIQILGISEDKRCVKFTYKPAAKSEGAMIKKELRGNQFITHFMQIRDDEALSMFNDTTYDEE